jgi:hypothetical protein
MKTINKSIKMGKLIFSRFYKMISKPENSSPISGGLVNNHGFSKKLNCLRILKVACLILIFITTNSTIFSQTVSFGYDDNGNRISRVLEVEKMESGMISFPVKNLPMEYAKAKEEAENVMEEETTVNIYPNPTKGILNIEISNLSEEGKVDLSVYDLNGAKLINDKNLAPITDLDISKLKDGIYILQIKLNGINYNWKIVKNH